MAKTGIADLPLHYGNAPRWLFDRMVRLSGVISKFIIEEHGESEFLRRISNPFFFQSFCCAIGFDWHSSGATTTACGALKVALEKEDIGIRVVGGKGKVAMKVPEEIKKVSKFYGLDDEHLTQVSRMVAKVDNNCVQDGFSLYHHALFISQSGEWAVVQQGMNPDMHVARRYHWLSDIKSFVIEPHTAVCCDIKNPKTLDLTAFENLQIQKLSLEIVNEAKDIKRLAMSHSHEVKITPQLLKSLERLSSINPKDYSELVGAPGAGAKTLRALALLSALIYGTEIKWRDPALYSFAHGGKDGYPYPVNRAEYDKSIEILRAALESLKDSHERAKALRRLSEFV
jgi:hypothetical protein